MSRILNCEDEVWNVAFSSGDCINKWNYKIKQERKHKRIELRVSKV